MILAAAIVGLFVLPDPWRIVFLFCAALIEVGEVFFWIRFLRRYRVTTGAEGLIGEHAEVIEALTPGGRVRLRGEIWNARGKRPVARGAGVRVVALDGLTLVVEAAGDGNEDDHGKGPL